MRRHKLACLCSLAVLALATQPAPGQPGAPAAAGQPDAREADQLQAQVAALIDGQRYYDAEPLARRLFEMRQRLHEFEDPRVIDAARYLARVHRAQRRHAEAGELLVRVLSTLEGAEDRNNVQVRRAANELAALYDDQALSGPDAEREALHRRALAVRQRVLGRDDINTVGSVQTLIGLYESARRWDDAEPLQRRLLEREQRLRGAEHADVATQHNIIAFFYARAGRAAEAEQHFRQALEMRERLFGANDLNTQQSVTNLHNFYRQVGRNEEAAALTRRYGEAPAATAPSSTPPRRNVLALGDAATSARLDRERAQHSATEAELTRLTQEVRQLKGAGRYLEAEPPALRAFELAQTLGDIRAMEPLDDLVEIQLALGRYGEAEPLARRAFEERRRHELSGSGNWGPQLLNAAHNLASVYHAQRRLDEAEQLYRQINQSAGPSLSFGRRAANQLGRLMLERGEFDLARQWMEALLSAYLRGTFVTPDELIAGGNLWAEAFTGLGRHEDAAGVLEANLRRNERRLGADHPETLSVASMLASSYAAQRRLSDAIPLHRRAVEGSERAVGRQHPATLSYLSNLVSGLLSDPGSQGTALEPARMLVEGARARRMQGLSSQQAQVQERVERNATANQFALFADAAWSSVPGAGQRAAVLPEAFAALQDSLSGSADRSIAEQAARRYAQSRNEALAALVRERGRLQEQWTELNNRLAAVFVPGSPEQDSGVPAALRQQLAATQARIAAIDARLRAEAPDYFALIAPAALDVPATQRLLAADEAILLVVPSAFGTHVVAVTREAVEWRRSAWNAERMRAAVRALRRDIDRRPRFGPGGARAFDRGTAHQLYQELVAPVAGVLAGRRQVYVAAGGSLAALPFSMLVSAPPSGTDDDPAALRATRWLGDDVALVHIPSVQSLALLRRAPRQAGAQDSFFGVGNPVLRGESAAAAIDVSAPRGTDAFFQAGRTRDGGVMANVTTLQRLSPLPGTARELEAVRTTLGAPATALLMADRATEPNVRGADLSRTRILHFATHGLTVAEGAYVGAGESGLVLTPPAQARDGDDGFLAASEVTTLRLDADWVILSACNTATGDGVNSAGLGGLARAFFYAGARNLLASHWLVSDEVAPVMITRTLTLERAGTPRAEAFRQAMREIRMDTSRDAPTRSWAHPYYWAPFVLIGDGGRERRDD